MLQQITDTTLNNPIYANKVRQPIRLTLTPIETYHLLPSLEKRVYDKLLLGIPLTKMEKWVLSRLRWRIAFHSPAPTQTIDMFNELAKQTMPYISNKRLHSSNRITLRPCIVYVPVMWATHTHYKHPIPLQMYMEKLYG